MFFFCCDILNTKPTKTNEMTSKTFTTNKNRLIMIKHFEVLWGLL